MSSKASSPKLSAEDKAWRGREDARTLAESKVILSDPSRLKAAAREAGKMAKDRESEAKAMKQIARKGGGK